MMIMDTVVVAAEDMAEVDMEVVMEAAVLLIIYMEDL